MYNIYICLSLPICVNLFCLRHVSISFYYFWSDVGSNKMQSLLHHFNHLHLLSANKVSRVDSEDIDLQWEGFLYLRGLSLLAPPPLKRWQRAAPPTYECRNDNRKRLQVVQKRFCFLIYGPSSTNSSLIAEKNCPQSLFFVKPRYSF